MDLRKRFDGAKLSDKLRWIVELTDLELRQELQKLFDTVECKSDPQVLVSWQDLVRLSQAYQVSMESMMSCMYDTFDWEIQGALFRHAGIDLAKPLTDVHREYFEKFRADNSSAIEHLWALRSDVCNDAERCRRQCDFSDADVAQSLVWLRESLRQLLNHVLILESRVQVPNSLDEESRVLIWNGSTYSLTKNILAVMSVLYRAWESGKPIVSLDQLRNSVDSHAIDASLYKVFARRRNGKKYVDPSWKLIELVGEGLYRLKE